MTSHLESSSSPALEKVVPTALTAWGQAEDRRRTADAGFDHHLMKSPGQKLVENVVAQLEHQKER